ncbi:hypothetical protein [Streptomyces aureoversilis]|uniref:Uncharacterized protein n=1 Tax=Streptomyces aureoversilis TaxID=67277 RepID=A0ABV9ZV04_9ACTN
MPMPCCPTCRVPGHVNRVTRTLHPHTRYYDGAWGDCPGSGEPYVVTEPAGSGPAPFEEEWETRGPLLAGIRRDMPFQLAKAQLARNRERVYLEEQQRQRRAG